MTINLIGAGLGPLATALCTDHLFGDRARLPQAIALVCAMASSLSVAVLSFGPRDYRAHVQAAAEPAPAMALEA